MKSIWPGIFFLFPLAGDFMTIWVAQIDDELIKIYNLISQLISGNKKFILLGEQCISLYLRDKISNRIAKKHGIRYRLKKRILSITIITNRKGVKKYRMSLNVSDPRRSCIIDLDEEKINNYLKETVLPFIEGYNS